MSTRDWIAEARELVDCPCGKIATALKSAYAEGVTDAANWLSDEGDPYDNDRMVKALTDEDRGES